MVAEQTLDLGKYEAAYYLKNTEMARLYLAECVKGGAQGGVSEKSALESEIQNILYFAKSHYDDMTYRRIGALLNLAKQR